VRRILILGLLCCNGVGLSQTVCLGNSEQCREAQKRLCANEKAEANLVTSGAKVVGGDVRDPSGATFPAGYIVQLRDSTTGQVLRFAVLDSAGRFSFTDVPSVRIRLLVVRLVEGKIVRPPLFNQPSGLACESLQNCDLKIVLKVHGTDDPLDYCPPK
jgi:hypothetical protein